MTLRLIALTSLSVLPALACSCISQEPILACEMLHQAPVIVHGKIIDEIHDSPGLAWTLYRLRVTESFKGLPAGTNDVFIDPGNFYGCPSELRVGKDYLVYANLDKHLPLAPTLANYLIRIRSMQSPRTDAKQLPASWKHLGSAPVVMDGGMCVPTRTVQTDDPDLRYLRIAARDQLPRSGSIQGRAVQNWEGSQRTHDYLPVPGAEIMVKRAGKMWRTYTDHDGTYTVPGLSPGRYQVSVSKAKWGPARFPIQDPEGVVVPLSGCAVMNASFNTFATISGTLLNANGSPARGVYLQLGEVRRDRKLRVIRGAEATTDDRGRFGISNVPVGRVVVGINIDSSPVVHRPFDATYSPGTPTLGAAQIFSLQRDEQVSGIVFRLPPPLPFAHLLVEVRWPDGSPATNGARASAEWNGAESAREQALKSSHQVRLPLALGRSYAISASWFSDRASGYAWAHGAEVKQVLFTRDHQTITLRLKEKVAGRR